MFGVLLFGLVAFGGVGGVWGYAVVFLCVFVGLVVFLAGFKWCFVVVGLVVFACLQCLVNWLLGVGLMGLFWLRGDVGA